MLNSNIEEKEIQKDKVYNIYWNNICLLSKAEEEFINSHKQYWEEEIGCSFIIQYYGLSRKKKISEKLREDLVNGKVIGDILISTDLDIFQDKEFRTSYIDDFQNIEEYFEIREEISSSTIVSKDPRISPFITIPLVIVVNKKLISEEDIPLTLESLIDSKYAGKILFGGMGNSAGRSVIKAFWYLYGEKGVESFLINARATTLPVMAFNAVIKGEVPIAIVPSIFAMRKGISDIVGIWPKEGAIAVPSYIAFKKDFPTEYINMLKNTLFGVDKQNFYSERGNIFPTNPKANIPQWAEENGCRFLYPHWEWMDSLDLVKFENYCKKVQKYI